MIWNVKIIEETKQGIVIGYSKGSSFDGIIEYDKRSEKFKVVLKASDCDEFESERLFQFLYTMISQNKLSFKAYSIRIG